MTGNINSDLYTAWSNEHDGEKKAAFLAGLIPRLKRHAGAVVYNQLHERNEEIVAQAIWQAIREDSGFRGESKFSTWFHRVVINLCTDYLRQKLSRNETALDENYSDEGGLVESVVGSMTVQKILDSLNPEEKRLVEMRLAGYTDEEISETLGMERSVVQRKRIGLQEKVRGML